MTFDWWTFALQTVNFAVLVWLLHRFLYRPVLRLIDERRAGIEAEVAAAHAEREKARALRAEAEARLAAIDAEREAALQEAAQSAEEAAVARRAQAQREAEALMDDTRKALAGERAAALVEAQALAADLAERMARRLLEETSAGAASDAWLRLAERRLAELRPAERDALRRELDQGKAVKVVTAVELPAAAAGEWRERLRRELGIDARVDFETDDGLVAGAELHFPSTVLRLSWKNALAALRSEIEPHEHPR